MSSDRLLLLTGPLLVVLTGCTGAACAEQAVDADGHATPGILALDGVGRLRFTPTGEAQPLSPDAIAFIRFSVAAAESFRAGSVRRVLLDAGQRITGRFLSTDGDTLSVRTAWAGRVNVPRSAAVALRQPRGRQSVFEDDFADGLKAWTVSGEPAVDRDPPAVALTGPGQALNYTPSEAPDVGRIGVNFRNRDAAGARWSAEFRFQADGKTRTLGVVLAGAGDAYEVEAPGLDGDGRRVARSSGLHRLEVRFSRDSLSVLCDDAVILSNLKQGPGGPLQRTSLVCSETASAGPVRGRVEFTDFALTRAVDEVRRPLGDAGQDEVWLADGDQFFGDIRHIDRQSIEIDGFFGKRTLPWSRVCGCWFKGVAAPAPAVGGDRVRLEIESGIDPEPDVLVGVVKALDDKELTLQHPQLGELHIPRGYLRRLRFL